MEHCASIVRASSAKLLWFFNASIQIVQPKTTIFCHKMISYWPGISKRQFWRIILWKAEFLKNKITYFALWEKKQAFEDKLLLATQFCNWKRENRDELAIAPKENLKKNGKKKAGKLERIGRMRTIETAKRKRKKKEQKLQKRKERFWIWNWKKKNLLPILPSDNTQYQCTDRPAGAADKPTK